LTSRYSAGPDWKAVMLHSLRWLLLAFLSLLSGCFPVVYSEEPLGADVAVLKPDEWNGLWIQEDRKLVRLLVTDPANGELTSIEPYEECNSKSLEGSNVQHIQLRQHGLWYFPYGYIENGEAPYPAWFVILRHGQAVTSCPVDEARVRTLVKEGALPGRFEDQKIVLGPLKSEHYRILLSSEPPAYRCDPPKGHVSIRLPSELDPCSKLEQAK